VRNAAGLTTGASLAASLRPVLGNQAGHPPATKKAGCGNCLQTRVVIWWAPSESNRAPTDYESAALTRHELEALQSPALLHACFRRAKARSARTTAPRLPARRPAVPASQRR